VCGCVRLWVSCRRRRERDKEQIRKRRLFKGNEDKKINGMTWEESATCNPTWRNWRSVMVKCVFEAGFGSWSRPTEPRYGGVGGRPLWKPRDADRLTTVAWPWGNSKTIYAVLLVSAIIYSQFFFLPILLIFYRLNISKWWIFQSIKKIILY